MSVPLDRLYNFLQDICNQDIIIYRWLPHGSKKLEDLTRLAHYEVFKNSYILITKHPMICHDQEPLNFTYWSENDFVKVCVQQGESLSIAKQFAPWHLRTLLDRHKMHVFTKTMLCHSELNSEELKKYQQKGFVGVYYWSHALIARDWFRYAQLDKKLQEKNICQDFLIYNRAWSSSREYRLKFAELVVNHNLTQHCRMGFNPIDEISYHNHVFKNSQFQIENYNLDQHFFLNNTSADASADYINQDYQQTAIEVILETIFDDQRWHLTEKTLRPIACGQPFILLSTPHSLDYLRSYGFKTFDSVIDESYDKIKDPLQRMQAVIDLMQRISCSDNKTSIFKQLFQIAKYNQRRFFSTKFHQQVVEEFQKNFSSAYQETMQNCSPQYWQEYVTAITNNGDYYKIFTKKELELANQAKKFVYDFIQQTQNEIKMVSNPPVEDFPHSQ